MKYLIRPYTFYPTRIQDDMIYIYMIKVEKYRLICVLDHSNKIDCGNNKFVDNSFTAHETSE